MSPISAAFSPYIICDFDAYLRRASATVGSIKFQSPEMCTNINNSAFFIMQRLAPMPLTNAFLASIDMSRHKQFTKKEKKISTDFQGHKTIFWASTTYLWDVTGYANIFYSYWLNRHRGQMFLNVVLLTGIIFHWFWFICLRNESFAALVHKVNLFIIYMHIPQIN